MKKTTPEVRLDVAVCLILMAVFVKALDIPNDTTDTELWQEGKTEEFSMKNPEITPDKVLFFVYIHMLTMDCINIITHISWRTFRT